MDVHQEMSERRQCGTRARAYTHIHTRVRARVLASHKEEQKLVSFFWKVNGTGHHRDKQTKPDSEKYQMFSFIWRI